MRAKLTPLIKLWYNPVGGMSDLAAQAPYVTAGLLALGASFIYGVILSGDLSLVLYAAKTGYRTHAPWLLARLLTRLGSSITPLVFLSVVFTPVCLFVSNLWERRASFRVILRQEYAPLVSAILYSWAAAQLMMLAAIWVGLKISGSPWLLQPGFEGSALETAVRILPLPYFIFLVAIALRVVLRQSWGQALGSVAISALSLLVLPLLPSLLFIFTSPFLLILLFLVLRSFFGDMMSAQRAREQFKQSMQAATLNPADASAHYNLGLLYQQHGQVEEAKTCFLRAIQIDPEETDAHYQLGRIARERGELSDAIAHFDGVVTRNPDHSLGEVWREIGRAYFQAGQLEDALSAFERFIAKRESDAEGRYYYGLTLHKIGRDSEAVEQMNACIESVRTSPAYKYRVEKRWMTQAQTFLRTLEVGGS